MKHHKGGAEGSSASRCYFTIAISGTKDTSFPETCKVRSNRNSWNVWHQSISDDTRRSCGWTYAVGQCRHGRFLANERCPSNARIRSPRNFWYWIKKREYTTGQKTGVDVHKSRLIWGIKTSFWGPDPHQNWVVRYHWHIIFSKRNASIIIPVAVRYLIWEALIGKTAAHHGAGKWCSWDVHPFKGVQIAILRYEKIKIKTILRRGGSSRAETLSLKPTVSWVSCAGGRRGRGKGVGAQIGTRFGG